jgi:hypothetical protein
MKRSRAAQDGGPKLEVLYRGFHVKSTKPPPAAGSEELPHTNLLLGAQMNGPGATFRGLKCCTAVLYKPEIIYRDRSLETEKPRDLAGFL